MALFLDILPGEEVAIGPDQAVSLTVKADRKDRSKIRLGLTFSAKETVEFRIGDAIVCAAQEKGRRVQLKLDVDRSIPIEHKNKPGSGGPPKP